MRLSKEEFKKKIDEKIQDEDLKIELLEDVEDSVDVTVDESEKVDKTEFEDLKMKYEDLKIRYKERFLSNDEVETPVETEEKEETEEVIDVKEI